MTTLTGEIARSYLADLINTQQYAVAEPLLLDALHRTPNVSFLLTALGVTYRSTGRFDAAEACYRRSLALNARDAEAWSNLGNLLTDMNRLDEARVCSEEAVSLDPKSYLFRKNLAVTLRECKMFERARKEFETCLAEKPDDANIRFNLGMIHLYLRQLDKGWDYFEHRFATNRISMPKLEGMRQWHGESLQGRRLLLIAEQGFGDTILMTRFIPILRDAGATITLSCKKALHALFSGLPARMIAESDIRALDFDFYSPMMSIPRLTIRDWLLWPSAPSLVADLCPETARITKKNSALRKIGIVWSGSVTYGENQKRSVTVDRFLKLAARFPRIEFFSFQKGDRETDLQHQGQATIIPLGHLFENFSQTAAALLDMDCIIMTDSALVHLAGSLNVPVIDLLHFKPYWLYFPENQTTPLYPSLRFIRQAEAGDWDAVFKQVGVILEKLLQLPGDVGSAAIMATIDQALLTLSA